MAHALTSERSPPSIAAMQDALDKATLKAIAAAAMKVREPSSLNAVWAATGGDIPRAQAGAWQLVRTGGLNIAKSWLASAPLAHGLDPLPWPDLEALVSQLPDTLVLPGGAKNGWGFIVMVDPAAPGDAGIPDALARMAVRSALSDGPAYAAGLHRSFPPKIQLALDYGLAVARLPLADDARARVLQALARAAVTRDLPPTIAGRGPDGTLIDVELWSGSEPWQPQDMFALASSFAARDEWDAALAAALLAELAFMRENRYQAQGIRHLDHCVAALPRLTPTQLVEVLANGQPGGQHDDAWALIAEPVLDGLSGDSRALALAAAEDSSSPLGCHFQDRVRERLSAGAARSS